MNAGTSPNIEIAELARSGLFDGDWYLAANQDVRAACLDPLAHWYNFGCQEARNPNPYFATAWYLAQNPDVALAGLNPLIHYLRHGEREGRRPTQHFEPAWYRAAYEIPDADLALRHFLASYKTGRFAPRPDMYSVSHLPTYKAQLEAGDDAFGRALEDAEREGRGPSPDPLIVAESGLLDLNYYLINGTDVHEAELDPHQHFCHFGWQEGRKPNIYFDPSWYLRTNPDVARMRINPLVHYILEGETAGRRPIVYFDPLWYRATYAIDQERTALAHFLVHRRKQTYSPNPMFDPDWYIRRAGGQVGPRRDPFAHYLQAGTLEDIDPSERFNAAEYRRTHLGRPSRMFRHLMHPEKHNPLVHYLQALYR